MPRLREYVNGRGWYIVGTLPPGNAFCTWQLGDPGRRQLAGRGIRRHGDRVSGTLLRELLENELAGTGGQGTAHGGETVPPPDLCPLVTALETWSGTGGIDGLTRTIHPPGHDHRGRCSSRGFLGWLAGLDRAVLLDRFDSLSATGFEDLARSRLDRLHDDPLHQWFVGRGSVGVLWRLARVVGTVAGQPAPGSRSRRGWSGRSTSSRWSRCSPGSGRRSGR